MTALALSFFFETVSQDQPLCSKISYRFTRGNYSAS